MRLLLPLLLSLLCSASAVTAQLNIGVEASALGGSGAFAPYFHVANREGIVSTNPLGGYLRAGVNKPMKNTNRGWDWGAGGDIVGSIDNFYPVHLQQLYVEGAWSVLDLQIGMKEYNHSHLNRSLSSGSMMWSGNARPIPQARIGIFDFVNFPWTNGWLQIRGELSYGVHIENRYINHTYNYQYATYANNIIQHNKQLWLRSKEDKPFVFTAIADITTQFGGEWTSYIDGVRKETHRYPVSFKSFLQAFIPGGGDSNSEFADQAYLFGNTLGSWSFIGEYTFKDRSRLKGYCEFFFEDGTGMSKQNGFDGLWGLEYTTNRPSPVANIVVEYLQTTNQAGPIHFNPNADDQESSIQDIQVRGHDNYYKHQFYNGYTHQGLTLGNPMILSPMYNGDGYLQTQHNRVRGFHLGASGYIAPQWQYRLLLHYLTSWGTLDVPTARPLNNFSAMIEGSFQPTQLPGWLFTASTALDTGSLLKNNWGISVGVRKVFTINTATK